MRILTEGQQIRDTYVVERFLGEGAFAEVYRVKHRFFGRLAMKVLKSSSMTVAEIEEMLGEAILLSRIGHPNIVRVYEANLVETRRGSRGFFTMEYVAAGTLEDFWRSFGTTYVPVDTAVELVRQACRGLAVAHRANPPIVHRDVKPQNILVGYDDAGELRARLSDFGLAKTVNPLTMLASGKGTLRFKPPEVIKDYKSDSCAGDVWALGSTLYMLLTDRLPYAAVNDDDAYDLKHFETPLIPPSRLNVQVDSGLDQIVFRSLAVQTQGSGARYATAQDFLGDLEKWKLKPAASTDIKSASSSGDKSRAVFGTPSPADEAAARRMAAEAIEIARDPSQLQEAADLMEQAFNKCPDLRSRHEHRLKLWRKGIG